MKTSSPRLLLAVLPLWLGAGALAAAPLEQKFPPAPPADAAHPLQVWDVAAAARDGLPRNFRTTNDTLKAGTGALPDVTGLADLHASGSAAFTVANFKALQAKVTGPVTVFDLRQEEHVYVNGQPVSWYATNNWANVGRPGDAILAGEAARVQAIKPGATLELADAEAKKAAAGTAPETVVVSQVATEADVVTAAGAHYVRITVTDHCRPTDEAVDQFVLAVRGLPADAWAHFHCRAGKGRTTTFLALYDMLRNASRVSLNDIVNRQGLLIGEYNLLQSDEDSGWKKGVADDRAAFVRAFYDYARANPGGRPQLWTEWLKNQPAG